MEYTNAYLVIAMFLNGLFAIRKPHNDCRIVFVISMIWPVSLLLVVLIFALELIQWDMDVADSTKMFGFRKPGNPNIKGFAVTILYQEFQFYSTKKA